MSNKHNDMNKIFDEVSKNINELNTLSEIAFGFSIFNPKPNLLFELLKPLSSLGDLSIKLLQFGLLIDSVNKKNIDKFIKDKLTLSANDLKRKYTSITCSRVTNQSEVDFFRSLFNIIDKNVVFIKTRDFSTIDSLEIIWREEIKTFDYESISRLRLLRSFRNVSDYAHDSDPKDTQKRFKKLGFQYPLSETNKNEFWQEYLTHFLHIILKLKSSIQSYITKQYNEGILTFKSFFEKRDFSKNDDNRIIFEFENKQDSAIEFYAYKIDFLYENKILFPYNWHYYSVKIKPRDTYKKEWNKVKPFEYYNIKDEGKWKMITAILFKYEDEISTRIIEDTFHFNVISSS